MAVTRTRTAIITMAIAGVIACGIAWRVIGSWGQQGGPEESAFPLTLALLEEMSDGLISDYRISNGWIFVSVVDRFGDAHLHFLMHEGISQEEALDRLICKKTELASRLHSTLPMDVASLENGTASTQVPKVIRAAKEFWKPTESYWPEPSSVTEYDDFWWVKFKEKPTLVIQEEKPVVKVSVPGVVCIRVEKADLSCSLVPAR